MLILAIEVDKMLKEKDVFQFLEQNSFNFKENDMKRSDSNCEQLPNSPKVFWAKNGWLGWG